MISQTAEYALRAMVWLASNPDAPQTNQQIAEQAKVPPGYLQKVMQALGRGGLVTATRGVGGGFLLARPATGISIYEVIDAVDPFKRIHTCPLGLASHGRQLCPLHRRLDDALASTELSFRMTNLSELIDQPGQSVPLCEHSTRPAAVPIPDKR
jgi:Rrf2 family transcriptional regulator, nitric oxide-sensitive transcriptional repressor